MSPTPPVDPPVSPGTDAPASTAARPRTIRPSRGLPSGRAAVGGLLVAVAAIGTWAVAGGGAGSSPDRYVVARRPVAPGVELTDDDLGLVEADLPERLRSRAFSDPAELVGAVTRGPLGAGDLVQSGSVDAVASGASSVELSFSVEPGWAVAGDLRVGDRIAVFATDADGRTRVVLEDVHVLRITAPDDGGLGSDGTQTITIASEDEAAVTSAVTATRTGDVTVVRLTGPSASAETPDESGDSDDVETGAVAATGPATGTATEAASDDTDETER